MLPTLFFFFFLLQGMGVLARSHLPFLPTPEGITTSDMVSRSLGLPDSNGVRRPRNIVSILSLLWPQVVGPIENGIIKEEGYKEIPKTSLEHHLEEIRQRSKQQLLMRHHVRDLINDGGATSQLNLHELYALNNEMGGYHPHVAHPIFHPLQHHPLPPPYHPEEIPFFDSVIIHDSQLAPFPGFHEMIQNLHSDRHPKKLITHTTTKAPPLITEGETVSKKPHESTEHYTQKELITTETAPQQVVQNTQNQDGVHLTDEEHHQLSENDHDDKLLPEENNQTIQDNLHQITQNSQNQDGVHITDEEHHQLNDHDDKLLPEENHPAIHDNLHQISQNAEHNTTLHPQSVSPESQLPEENSANSDHDSHGEHQQTTGSHENLHQADNVVQLKGSNSENNVEKTTLSP